MSIGAKPKAMPIGAKPIHKADEDRGGTTDICSNFTLKSKCTVGKLKSRPCQGGPKRASDPRPGGEGEIGINWLGKAETAAKIFKS